MDISRWPSHRAGWAPAAVALHFEGTDVTYGELARRVAGLAGGLRRSLRLAPGDRIAYLGFNAPEMLELLFACARLGAIMVPLNWRLTPAEHLEILADCSPRALVFGADFRAHLAAIHEAMPEMALVACEPGAAAGPALPSLAYRALVEHGRGEPDPGAGDLGSPVLIVYTSGTTGRPKGAVLTQSALFHNALHSIAIHDMTSADHVLTVLPMFHVGGMNIQTTPAIFAGASVTIQRRFEPAEALRLIETRRPTLFLAVPAVAQALVAQPGFAAADLSSLRCMGTGSSTVPEALIRAWLDRGVAVTQVYGMTETSPIALALPIPDAARKAGSCGKPVLHCEARIVDERGRDVAAGERGEIWLRGPNLMTGYWGDPEATAAAFADGWFRTGDIAHRDSEGFYYVDDRKRDVVISGGENVYPAELENVLAGHPAVAEAAVVGRPDARWGEVPVACIVLRPGARLGQGEVLALFEGRLARYKRPRDVLFMDALPRNAMGKVQKQELRRLLAAAPESTGHE